jgi:transcriptional regulator with XRE-family HTH domain
MPIVLVRSGADLGVAIQEARRAAGLTQEQLAARTSLDRSYLARIEAGMSVLLLDRVLRVLRRLGAEVTVTIPEIQPPVAQAAEPRDREARTKAVGDGARR